MPGIHFVVKLGDGMPEDVRSWAVPGAAGSIDIVDNQLSIRGTASNRLFIRGTALNRLFIKDDVTRGEYDLSDLRYISYEDAGTKSNIAALAVFGVLGLGAKRSWTLITVGFPDRDAQFLVRMVAFTVRSRFQEAVESSPELARLVREGVPPTASTATVDKSNLDELERLVDLYERDLLTDDEFTAMKAKLIADS